MSQITDILDATGIQWAYGNYPDGATLPYLVCRFSYSSDLKADNRNYITKSNWQIELYTHKKDTVSEAAVENAMTVTPWDKTETYIEDDALYQVVWNLLTIGE